MSAKGKRKRKPKLKKVSYKDKIWFEVIAPKIFNYKEIGEIIGLETNVVGRVVEALLYDFTGDFNDINLKLRFKIIDVNPEARKCNSIFFGHQYTNDYIRALVGRGMTKIQTIENYTTKDGYVFRLTTVCVTIKRARSSQQIVIRKIMREILKEFAQMYNHEKFVKGMISGEFQNQIARVAKTIYPLSSCVIIKSKLISIPEGGEDKEVPDDEFEIVEIDVQRTRKSEIRRAERINVKKIAQSKKQVAKKETTTETKENETEDKNESKAENENKEDEEKKEE
ncbi:MAG: hypothetical protein ACTSVV_15195 [Promethearchaeota archaeon]